MAEFNRRLYPNLSTFLADFKAIMARRQQMGPLMRGETLDAGFRERLMLAVTAVNGCRYCSYAHARHALVAGIDEAEVSTLLAGTVDHSPAHELPALLYAQHWAETRGAVEPAARVRLLEAYGQEMVESIELSLRTIQMGNLMGNTLDYVLFRLSFGRLGNPGSTQEL